MDRMLLNSTFCQRRGRQSRCVWIGIRMKSSDGSSSFGWRDILRSTKKYDSVVNATGLMDKIGVVWAPKLHVSIWVFLSLALAWVTNKTIGGILETKTKKI
mmetsp:Transcript_1814/g.3834  ORF Transcript_1814/g.3834 Transcript_1814/m.3834 type:complete len:101 (-) Transcript_1814:824-1126(-)